MIDKRDGDEPFPHEENPEVQRADEDAFLGGLWYVAMPGGALRRGEMTGRLFFSQPILFGRRPDGSVFAIGGLCPHRGVPLHFGDFDGETVGCPYHGWRFDGSGACTRIPSLPDQQEVTLSRIRCGSFHVAEQQGLIWIFLPDPEVKADATPPPIEPFQGFESQNAIAAIQLEYNCGFDDAAFGLMDPAHVPSVHKAWWMKRKELRLKEKHFEPYGHGWRMMPHPIAKLTPAHHLLGRDVTTEIQLLLPGLRLELIYGERSQVLNLLAITPIDGQRTQMLQALWWTMPGAKLLAPVVRRAARSFLNQDAAIIDKQREGFQFGRRQLLVKDADRQMKWWLRLKREWREHRAEGRSFNNPITPTTLRWRT